MSTPIKYGRRSLKCPTCILFDQNKTCDSFGYEAEAQYADVVLEEKSENQYYFFKHFKMKISTQQVRLSADRYKLHFVYVSIWWFGFHSFSICSNFENRIGIVMVSLFSSSAI